MIRFARPLALFVSVTVLQAAVAVAQIDRPGPQACVAGERGHELRVMREHAPEHSRTAADGANSESSRRGRSPMTAETGATSVAASNET